MGGGGVRESREIVGFAVNSVRREIVVLRSRCATPNALGRLPFLTSIANSLVSSEAAVTDSGRLVGGTYGMTEKRARTSLLRHQVDDRSDGHRPDFDCPKLLSVDVTADT